MHNMDGAEINSATKCKTHFGTNEQLKAPGTICPGGLFCALHSFAVLPSRSSLIRYRSSRSHKPAGKFRRAISEREQVDRPGRRCGGRGHRALAVRAVPHRLQPGGNREGQKREGREGPEQKRPGAPLAEGDGRPHRPAEKIPVGHRVPERVVRKYGCPHR